MPICQSVDYYINLYISSSYDTLSASPTYFIQPCRCYMYDIIVTMATAIIENLKKQKRLLY